MYSEPVDDSKGWNKVTEAKPKNRQAASADLSLKAKVALTASVVFVLFVATVSWISFRYFEREFRNSIYTQQVSLVSALTKTMDDKLRFMLGALSASAARVPADVFSDPQKAQDFLDQQGSLHAMFDTGVMLIGKDGSLVAEAPFREGRRGKDMAMREFFQHALITQKPYISKPYASTRNKNEPALHMSAPVFDKSGQFIGLLVGHMDLLGDNLMVQIGKVKNGAKGYVYMTDRDGLMILHVDKKRLLTATLGKNPMYDKAYAGFEGVGETITSYGDAVIVTFKRVESTGWIFASNYMLEEARAPFDRALHYVSLAIGGGCILLILIVSTLVRRLIDPLSRFTEHVSTLPTKSGPARLVEEEHGGEIGILVRSFNQMIATLDQQQAVLQQNESRLAGMIEESPVGVFETDGHGNCTFVNNRWCQIAGITSAQAMGDGWYRALHPDDVRRVWDEWLAAASSGKPLHSSYRFVHENGDMRWVLGQAAPIFNQQGEVMAYVGTNTDITEQTMAEEEIQRLASIVRYSPDFIAITDISGRATFINEAGRSLVGLQEFGVFDEVHLADFFPVPDAQMVHDQIIPHLMQHGRFTGELQFRHFNSGQTIPVWFDIFRIDDAASGKPINFATVTRDITERKRMDQELSQYREHLEELVQERTAELHQAQQIGHMGNWKWDVASGQITWSDEVCRIFGHLPGQYEPTLERLLSTLHPDDVERIRNLMKEAFKKGERHSIDSRIVRPDGSIRWVHTEAVARSDESGRIKSFSGTIQDITERKQVEQELITSREAAEAASRAKSLFLSSMSHELRTPLNAVLGFAQLLSMEDDLNEDVHNSAAEIEKAGRHLLALVNDILDLARIESGRVELSIEDVDPAEILRDCHKLLEPQARARDISLDLNLSAPVILRGDRIRLRQVLLNLLSNAVKYNRDGGRVSVRGDALPGQRYRLTIHDTGPGIAPERLTELFQPFNRIGAERGTIEGTGIGLVITKTLVQAMNGLIGVESVLGEGSSFWVELELTQATAAPEPEEELPPQYPGAILAAEDHEPNRKLLRRQIEKLGYRVDFACDGSEALEKWQAGDYDLILTDCNMAVMDGYELAQAVRAKESLTGGHIPIVALTANAAKDAAAACAAAGMDDFLAKPVELKDLQAMLQKWLSSLQNVKPAPRSRIAPRPPQEQRPAYADYLENLAQMLGDDDPQEAARMLHGFLDSAAECINDAKWALQRRDTITFVRAVHKLKSSARMIGATALSDLCQKLEQTGLKSDWALLEADMPSLLASLRETEERIQTLPRQRGQLPAEVRSNELQGLHVMLVDDDPFMLDYLSHLLSLRGAQGVRQENDARIALAELAKAAHNIDVLLFDVNMPGMDGVEFLRHLAKHDYRGALIVISGAADLLPSIYELAQAHGLRIWGTLAKPFMPERLYELLRHCPHPGELPLEDSDQDGVMPTELAAGLARNEFVPYFQPKLDLKSGLPCGAEALARWRRQDGSLITPLQFIAPMEAHGFIDSLFIAMLQSAMQALAALREAGYPDLRIALNLAASTLGTINLPEHIDQQLKQYDIKPENLMIEITESGVMQDARIGLDVLLRLRLKGIGLSIDDFGTGYSTIDQLRRLPFTELKIDRSFVASASQNEQARIILQSSVEMAKRLQLQTVAEGVEKEADLQMVQKLGCDLLQGYIVAEPMPLPEFIVWLKSWHVPEWIKQK
ncbi:EAL domain-containing protein [Massilia sp. W12]|uniref:EAL domain-containing protein n=1 Tax=Massilia sp. W12 TaxID=3126507 RepID=UPI0030D1B452